ncbi:MAG: NHL repeat-containing protein [candidate division KSB1 bacterium]|nr:NHL repeat-containing protein [candidate division KSB1 bacterium]
MKFVELKYLSIFIFLLTPPLFSQAPHISPLFSFGEKGETPGSFLRPLSLSVDAQGNIYVLDYTAHRLQKFSPQGNLLTFVGGFGWNARQFQFPQKVFVYNSLDVFVADYENKRIERYDKDLNWVASYYPDPNRPLQLQFFFPRAVCISLHGDFIIIDGEYNRVLKYNARFEPEISFGDFDWGKGRLVEPASVVVTKKDLIVVTDPGDRDVKIYDYFGNFLLSLDGRFLNKPFGVAVDPVGRIFVSDIEKHQIHIFNADFSYNCSFGSLGDKLGAFNEPTDIAIFRDLLYVADAGNHRIQIFQITWENKTAEPSE